MNMMFDPHQDSSSLEILAEFRQDSIQLQAAQPPVRVLPARPDLERVLAEIGPLPREALFVGVAEDGLPVLLNIADQGTGSILVAGDNESGKTALLRTVLRGAVNLHSPESVLISVLTGSPEEWDGVNEFPHCNGIFPFYDNSAVDLLHSLSGWTQSIKGGKQTMLLLLDGLDPIEHLDYDERQIFRWLFLRGPANCIRPIVTLTAGSIPRLGAWLDVFQTRILGRISDEHLSQKLVDHPDPSFFKSLGPGFRFALREGRGWLKFWIPA